MISFSRITHNVCQDDAPHQESTLVDIMAQHTNDTSKAPLYMLGKGGAQREISLVQHMQFENFLPVLLGLGFGFALRHILANYPGPIAIIDKEKEILSLTNALQDISPEDQARICFIDSSHAEEVLRLLTLWQKKHGGLPFKAVPHPFYMRLDKLLTAQNQSNPDINQEILSLGWYGSLRKKIEASTTIDFWAKVRKPRFVQDMPRILLITSKYFLMGEIIRACRNLGIPYQVLTLPDDSISSQEFIENLLKAVVDFQPDCLLTLNHLGVDREGLLMDLLEQLQMPLASWFVDNPHLIVHLYEKLKNPWVTIFTWDADNIESLHHMGFQHVFHLPLGTDIQRFSPNTSGQKSWKSRISFVGNSMVHKVATRLEKTALPDSLLQVFAQIAQDFDLSQERSVATFIQSTHPEIYKIYSELPSNEERLGFETAITWEATRIYRAKCVAATLAFTPLIVGDTGWENIFAHEKATYRLHRELNYYTELPQFYPLSDINFNCTSKQMKGAVNQRIFDVPACNAFVLTDWRAQMDELFEPHKEIAFYTEPEEAPELIRYYLDNPQERMRIANAARKRVLAEHTWEHRLKKLLKDMRSVYGDLKAHTLRKNNA